MATELLQQVITELEKLHPTEQNAVAARLLEEIKDNKLWAESFAETSDEQWDRLAASVKREIAAGEIFALDTLCGELKVHA